MKLSIEVTEFKRFERARPTVPLSALSSRNLTSRKGMNSAAMRANADGREVEIKMLLNNACAVGR